MNLPWHPAPTTLIGSEVRKSSIPDGEVFVYRPDKISTLVIVLFVIARARPSAVRFVSGPSGIVHLRA